MNSPLSKLRCTTVQAERARELMGPSPRVGRDNSQAFQQHFLLVTGARQLGRSVSRTRNFCPRIWTIARGASARRSTWLLGLHTQHKFFGDRFSTVNCQSVA